MPSTPKAEKKSPLPSQTIHLSAGDSTAFSPDVRHEAQWYVQWSDTASANVISTKAKDGDSTAISQITMLGVAGHVMKQGRPSSTFESRKAWADQAQQVLVLQEDVHVRSPKPKAELTCDRLTYDAHDRVFRAKGHVRVIGDVGTIGPLSQLWASQDLKVVATPEMFTAK